MNCLHCERIIRKPSALKARVNFTGDKLWEHEHNGCIACDPDDMNSTLAEPNWVELIDGFGRKMDELAKAKVTR